MQNTPNHAFSLWSVSAFLSQKTGSVANTNICWSRFYSDSTLINEIWLRIYSDIGAKKWRLKPLNGCTVPPEILDIPPFGPKMSVTHTKLGIPGYYTDTADSHGWLYFLVCQMYFFWASQIMLGGRVESECWQQCLLENNISISHFATNNLEIIIDSNHKPKEQNTGERILLS